MVVDARRRWMDLFTRGRATTIVWTVLVIAEVIVLETQLVFVHGLNRCILITGEHVPWTNPHNASNINPIHHVGTIAQEDVVVCGCENVPSFVVPAAHVIVVDINRLAHWSVARKLPRLFERLSATLFNIKVVTVRVSPARRFHRTCSWKNRL